MNKVHLMQEIILLLSCTQFWFFLPLSPQLPAPQPSWCLTHPVDQKTSRCHGNHRRALSPTWLWQRMQRATSGPVTPAAPPARSLDSYVDSGTKCTQLVLMKSASEPRATWKWFTQVDIQIQSKLLSVVIWYWKYIWSSSVTKCVNRK